MTFTPRQLETRLPAGARRWWVAFSGGLDSTVLLHALVTLAPATPVRALHVHHGLSAHADDWQAHCQRVCETLGVALSVKAVDLDPHSANLEERARQARYDVMADLLAPGDVLLMAHHQNDQAETLMLRLMRGAGPEGLTGMPAGRPLGAGRLARPLLGFARADLEDYARQHGLHWVEDESNRDTRFDRNYVRAELMPRLAERWPAVYDSLQTSGRFCEDSARLMADLARLDLAHCGERAEPWGWSLQAPALSALAPHRRANTLRHWWRARIGTVPGEARLGEIDRQFCRQQPGHGAQIRVGQSLMRAFDERLYLLPRSWQPGPAQPPLAWDDPRAPAILPGADQLRWESDDRPGALAPQWLERPMQIRWRAGGERCQPAGRAHSQTLKKLLQAYRLPTWLRARVPLVYIDGQLAAVGDLWVCEPFSTGPGQSGYRCRWSAAD